MLEFFDTNIVIYALVPFLLGALVMLIYYRIKSQFKASNLANIEVIDTIISQYNHRLDQYEGIINELKIKTELLESKISKKPDNIKNINHAIDDSTSQQISQYSEERNELSELSRVITESNDVKMTASDEYFHTRDTLEIILKLLLNGPLTSREIQRGIRRTREHTSRVMKKLYELKYVDRDINHKPFRYNITDLGRLQTYDHVLSDNESTVSVHNKSTRH
jgi:Sugar-specific transcriptional regulator TrmB.